MWSLPSDKAFIFTVMLSWGRWRGRERDRTSSLRKLPSALLHHCRSASPSSSPGCPPLDTLNWIPVRCAASPWVSFLRVTEHAVCVCASVCVCVCVRTSLCVKKLSSFPYKKLPTQNDRRTQTCTLTHTLTHFFMHTTDTQFKAQFASGSGL